MIIRKEILHGNYYKDVEGNIIPQGESFEIPEGAVTFHSVIATVKESLFAPNDNGEFREILQSEMGFQDDLALAIMEHEKLSLKDSIVAAGIACERCMNAMAHEYDLDWGYPECGDEWQACGTSCPFCEHMIEEYPMKITPADTCVELATEYAAANKKYKTCKQ